MYENLDTVGILNQSKIDEYKSSKGTSNDLEYLENIVSADDNSYINSFLWFFVTIKLYHCVIIMYIKI